MGVFGDLKKTYELHTSCRSLNDGSSTLEKSVHVVIRMDDVLKKMVRESEYNAMLLATSYLSILQLHHSTLSKAQRCRSA